MRSSVTSKSKSDSGNPTVRDCVELGVQLLKMQNDNYRVNMAVSRRALLKSVGLGAATVSLSKNGILGAIESFATAEESCCPRKPNVVVILCDQLRSFGCSFHFT